MFELIGPGGVLALLLLGGMIVLIALLELPEMMIAVLLVGQGFIHMAFALVGVEITRVNFALAGTILFLPIVLLMVMGRILGKGKRQEEVPFFGKGVGTFALLVLAFVVLLGVGLTYTQAPWYGAKKFRELLTFGVGPFLMTFLFIRDMKSVKRLMWWIMLMAGFFLVTSMIHSYRVTGDWFPGERLSRDLAFGFVPVLGGMTMGTRMVHFAGTALVLAWMAKNRIWRVMAGSGLVLILAAAINTSSRSAVVGMFLLALVLPKLINRGRWGVSLVTSGIMVMVLVGVFVLAPEHTKQTIMERITRGTTQGTLEAEPRTAVWKTAVEMIGKRPLLGYGTGGFSMYSEGRDAESFAHNMFLDAWCENGLPGFVLVAGLWGVVLNRIWKVYHGAPSRSFFFYAACWVSALLVGDFVTGMVHWGVAHAANTFLLTSGITLKVCALSEFEMSKAKTKTDNSGSGGLVPGRMPAVVWGGGDGQGNAVGAGGK